MKLFTDAEMIARLHPDLSLRQFRKMAKDRDLVPVRKFRDFWLWEPTDLERLNQPAR